MAYLLHEPVFTGKCTYPKGCNRGGGEYVEVPRDGFVKIMRRCFTSGCGLTEIQIDHGDGWISWVRV